MSYNNELVKKMLLDAELTPLVFDIETVPLPGAANFLGPVQAAKNLRDPEKIAADLERRERERDDDLALDWNCNRILTLGYWSPTDGVCVEVSHDDDGERALLARFWELAPIGRPLIGFNIRHFDLPTLIQRSRYLDVPYRAMGLRRGYGSNSEDIRDLFDILTFDDARATSCMSRSQKSFAKRFGIEVEDGDIDGAEVPGYARTGQWDPILRHVQADVLRSVKLAVRLGVIPANVAAHLTPKGH